MGVRVRVSAAPSTGYVRFLAYSIPRIFADSAFKPGDRVNAGCCCKGMRSECLSIQTRPDRYIRADHFSAALEVVALAFSSASGGDRTKRLATERLLCRESPL